MGWYCSTRAAVFLTYSGLCLGYFSSICQELSTGFSVLSGKIQTVDSSVPYPPDPDVFGPPGSGSTSQRYLWIRIRSGSKSGSGSFYRQAKIVRKTLIPTVLWLLLDFLSLKNDVNVPSKSNKQKNFIKKICFLLASWRSMMKIAGSVSAPGSISQRHESANPHQNVMDPEHWLTVLWRYGTLQGKEC